MHLISNPKPITKHTPLSNKVKLNLTAKPKKVKEFIEDTILQIKIEFEEYKPLDINDDNKKILANSIYKNIDILVKLEIYPKEILQIDSIIEQDFPREYRIIDLLNVTQNYSNKSTVSSPRTSRTSRTSRTLTIEPPALRNSEILKRSNRSKKTMTLFSPEELEMIASGKLPEEGSQKGSQKGSQSGGKRNYKKNKRTQKRK